MKLHYSAKRPIANSLYSDSSVDTASVRHFTRREFTVILKAGAAALAASSLLSVRAQSFPSRTIRIIVPYGPAGVVDTAPRLMAERLALDLGQPVVVDNKSGGLGMPAINEVLNAPADGHVILAADAGLWAITPAMQPTTYDFLRDFAPISLTFTNPIVIFTSTSSGINSLQDLIAQAKAKPGQLNYASVGIGSVHHLTIETLKFALGLDIKHVPYRGAGEMVESVLRGDTQVSMAAMNAVLPFAKAGKVKLLALTVATRPKQITDISTVAEITGLKDFNFPGQQGLVVKAGTPKAIIERLSIAIRKAALQPEVYNKVLEAGAEMTPNTPEQLTDLIRTDIVKYASAVKVSGVKPQ